jgi:hypothetical protein
VSPADTWTKHLEALHGTRVVSFPDLFLLVVHNGIIQAKLDSSLHVRPYIDRQHLYRQGPMRSQHLEGMLDGSVWMQGGCTSFYFGTNGPPSSRP